MAQKEEKSGRGMNLSSFHSLFHSFSDYTRLIQFNFGALRYALTPPSLWGDGERKREMFTALHIKDFVTLSDFIHISFARSPQPLRLSHSPFARLLT